MEGAPASSLASASLRRLHRWFVVDLDVRDAIFEDGCCWRALGVTSRAAAQQRY